MPYRGGSLAHTVWCKGWREPEDVRRNLFSLTFTLLALTAVVLADNLGSLAPVIIEDPPARLYFRPGRTITIQCRAQGTPAPSYEWYHNGKALASEDTLRKSGELVIHTKTQTSTGRYQCRARNEVGVAISAVTHLVEAEFGRVSLSERWKVRNYSVIEGFPIKLPCNHTQGIPSPIVSWYTVSCTRCLDEEPLAVPLNERVTMDDTGSLVLLHTVKQDGETGRLYKCISYNRVMQMSIGGSYARLHVQSTGVHPVMRPPSLIYQSQTPQSAIVGDTVVLRCFFDGVPSAEVQWKRIGGQLSGRMTVADHGRELRILKAKPTDSDKYQCEGRNAYGFSAALHNLTVYAPPMPLPMSNSSIISLTAVEGKEAVLSCSASGSSPITYEWFYNAQPLSDTWLHWGTPSGDSLVIYNLSLSASGIFTCNASNQYGYAIIPYYLTVQEPAPTTISTSTAAAASTSAEFDVTTEALPSTAVHDRELVTQNVSITQWGNSTMESNTTAGYKWHNHTQPTDDENVPNHGGELSGGSQTDPEDKVTPSWAMVLEIGIPLAFLLFVGGALMFVFLHLCHSKSSYAVSERERQFGCNDEYDSDDSGYDEKEEKSVKRQLKREDSAIQAECHV